MKQLSLKVNSRSGVGRTASRRLREADKIPAVIYGESGVRHLAIDRSDFRRLWKEISGRTALVELTNEGSESMLSLIKETQRDPRSDAFLHVDFKEIQRGKDMDADVAIHIVGDSYGVRNEGAIQEIHLYEVGVRCRPRHLPEFIEVNVSELRAGQSIYVRDLPKLEGVTYTSDEDIAVVTVATKVEEEAPAAEIAATEAAAAAPAPAAKK